MNRPDLERRIANLVVASDQAWGTGETPLDPLAVAALFQAAMYGELALALDEILQHVERAAPWIEEALTPEWEGVTPRT